MTDRRVGTLERGGVAGGQHGERGGSHVSGRRRASLLSLLLAASCLAGSADVHAAPPPNDAPDSYTAETTYAKLVRSYPFIRIASREVPDSVRALRGLVYAQHGSHALQLDLYLPAQPAPASAPLPAIVLVHGGGWRVGVRDNFAPMAIRMAQHGYAAATISYRLSSEAPYPAAIRDARTAVRWLRANAARYGIDPGRIALGGGSAGGQIASLAGVGAHVADFEAEAQAGAVPGAAVSSEVQAIVNIDGLSDFTDPAALQFEDDPRKQPSAAGAWFGGRYAEKTALWRQASPLFHVSARTPPVLFIASTQPRFSVGRVAMAEKLDALGIANRTLILPDTPHSFWLFDPWLAPTVTATVEFLDREMRARPAP